MHQHQAHLVVGPGGLVEVTKPTQVRLHEGEAEITPAKNTPIELRAWGVSPLAGVPNPIAVRAGEGVALSWQPPEDAGPARVHLELNVNHHGSTSNWIECDVEDTGSAQLPVALVDGLLERGRSGYPTLTVSRRSVSSAQIEPGCVELGVRSHRQTPLTVAGHTPCDSPDDCPEGQTCDLKIQTCM